MNAKDKMNKRTSKELPSLMMALLWVRQNSVDACVHALYVSMEGIGGCMGWSVS